MGQILRLLWLLGFAWSCTTQATCPPESSISPCYCQEGDKNGRLVECDRVDSLEELQQILSPLKGLRIQNLELYKANLGDKPLPYNLFRGLSISSLLISHSLIDQFEMSVDTLPFSGLEGGLVSLRLLDNTVRSNSPLMFYHLRYLATLEISGHSIPVVSSSWFRFTPSSLRYLYLNRNGIRKLDNLAFSNVRNLQVLELMANEITTLEASMFPKSLRELHLNMNQITTVGLEVLHAFPYIRIFDFSSNLIKTLHESAWGVVKPKVLVELTNNPLECTENMLWISLQNRTFSGTCAFPEHLRGTNIKDLVHKFIINE